MTDFLAVGHVSKDMFPEGSRLGGTVSFASVTAARLGRQSTVLTRAAQDVRLKHLLPDVEVLQLPSEATTSFENVYGPDGRRQMIRSVADPLSKRDLPPDLYDTPVVLLGPIAQEIDPGLVGCFGGLVGVTPQGWMRRWDAAGVVYGTRWTSASAILPHVDVVVMSQEDLGGHASQLEEITGSCKIVVLTSGSQGATVFVDDQEHKVAPRVASEVDPTGAGDVFAAAFLVRLQETDDPLLSARFANAVASFSVEGIGFQAIPSRLEVEEWLRANP